MLANRSQNAVVSFRNLVTAYMNLTSVDLPGVEGELADNRQLLDISLLDIQQNDSQDIDIFSSPKQLERDLVMVTLLPRSRWMSLLHLDIIQATH